MSDEEGIQVQEELLDEQEMEEERRDLRRRLRERRNRTRDGHGNQYRTVLGSQRSPILGFPREIGATDVFIVGDPNVGICPDTVQRALSFHPTSRVNLGGEGNGGGDANANTDAFQMIWKNPSSSRPCKIRIIPVGETHTWDDSDEEEYMTEESSKKDTVEVEEGPSEMKVSEEEEESEAEDENSKEEDSADGDYKEEEGPNMEDSQEEAEQESEDEDAMEEDSEEGDSQEEGSMEGSDEEGESEDENSNGEESEEEDFEDGSSDEEDCDDRMMLIGCLLEQLKESGEEDEEDIDLERLFELFEDNDSPTSSNAKPVKSAPTKEFLETLNRPRTTDPALTLEVLRTSDEFLKRPKEEQNLEYLDKRIDEGQLRVLKGPRWLSDSVIDYYLNMVVSRANESLPNPRFYRFDCTFYRLLDTHNGLESVRDAANKVDLFSYDIILFPALERDHWRLVVADVSRKTIQVFNSSSAWGDDSIRENIQEYLQQEMKRTASEHPERAPIIWKMIEEGGDMGDIPQQENGWDCGMFMLLFAKYICAGEEEFPFNQSHITYFRERILYECITQTLM